MGIRSLTRLMTEIAPTAFESCGLRRFAGQKLAVDGSWTEYRFNFEDKPGCSTLTNNNAVGGPSQLDYKNNGGTPISHLENEFDMEFYEDDDEKLKLSYLLDVFSRTCRLLENGVKPVYVFDGILPLSRQLYRENPELIIGAADNQENDSDCNNIIKGDGKKPAADSGDNKPHHEELIGGRLVKVTEEQKADSKALLEHMGVPFFDAPGEAIAQCAELVKTKHAYASVTEDVSTLTYGSNLVIRNLNFQTLNLHKGLVMEYYLDDILEDLKLSHEQFVDLCILLGCDYCSRINKIGPKKALELMQKHKRLEIVLNNIDEKKYKIPDDWPFTEARKQFLQPLVETNPDKLAFEWKPLNPSALLKYLVEEKGYPDDKVRWRIMKLIKVKSKLEAKTAKSSSSGKGSKASSSSTTPPVVVVNDEVVAT